MNDQRPSYHPDAARQAWARTLAFLQKNLKRS
jgi:dienelactone hydrolase